MAIVLGIVGANVKKENSLSFESDGNGGYVLSYVGENYPESSLVIPSTYKGKPVTRISSRAFSKNKNITAITIPDSVTIIGEAALEGCTSIKSITIPFVGATKGGTRNTYLGYIFGTSQSNNTVPSSLKKVVITGGMSIGSNAFNGCTGLTSITIPDGVTGIGNWAFSDCSSLTVITLPESLTSIGSSAFNGCTGLTSITIPDSVTSIDSYAFEDCRALTSITIPDSVTIIGEAALEGCTSIKSITIPFVGATKDGTMNTCLGYIFGASQSNNTVPSSLKNVVITGGTSIGAMTFKDCAGLTSISIPDSVTSIGVMAFKNCTGLTSITIPDSVTSLGDDAFYGCTGLTSITIPDSVTSIGSYAFGGWTSSQTISCKTTNKPSGWRSEWDYKCNAKIVWGAK